MPTSSFTSDADWYRVDGSTATILLSVALSHTSSPTSAPGDTARTAETTPAAVSAGSAAASGAACGGAAGAPTDVCAEHVSGSAAVVTVSTKTATTVAANAVRNPDMPTSCARDAENQVRIPFSTRAPAVTESAAVRRRMGRGCSVSRITA
ncbi:hypothetical protein GCM10010171_42810 [Actinokineospora fastidiosa]|uniref:Uncharacterized protein n=1 Tax=Actinokineospora fastidiosa TaxID=1816 RepID=A0A918GLF4_9PSEU|nr:hypothetical protein GCM10010171_42810 [Actinokineospora fastidiosa]